MFKTPAKRRRGKENNENTSPFVNYTPASTSFKRPRLPATPLAERTPQEIELGRQRYQEALEAAENDKAERAAEDVLNRARACLGQIKSAGFTLGSFLETIFTISDSAIKSQVTQMCSTHGPNIHEQIYLRDPASSKEWMSTKFREILETEAQKLQELLYPGSNETISDLLRGFSLERVLAEAQTVAPLLFAALSQLLLWDPDRKERKKKDVVLATLLCMLSKCRSDRASKFQVVTCIYLLACGAPRSLFEVLNHAGFSLSYDSAIIKLKDLSAESLEEIREIARTLPFMIVWDNINIAFKVGEQRKDSKDHFDNGTTATLIPLFDAPRNSMPLHTLPERTSRRITHDFSPSDDLLPSLNQIMEIEKCFLWHIEDILFEAYPALRARFKDLVDLSPPMILAIPLHKTKQYPLPAAHIDESTIDGTLQMIKHIFFTTLGLTEEDIKKHGVFFAHGDQLTVSLIERASGCRRDDTDLLDNPSRWVKPVLGLFHTKMAGARCVCNEHWGVANSKAPWSLWRMNTLLGRKAHSAGWKAKQLPPFRPIMELILKLVLPANILDGFRICCPEDTVDKWVSTLTSYSDLQDVARKVMVQLCSARRVAELRQLGARDVTLENIILFNRDALILMTLTAAVKRGDIGTVVNVLIYWMTMFRGTGKMPKYADSLFNTLMELKTMHPRVRHGYLRNWLVNLSGKPNAWKELDLLQEHQNFWLKIIYMAKGANRTWSWLGIVSTCIFTLRDVIRQVQSSFKTPHNGKSHTSPSRTDDLATVKKYLEDHTIQTYTPTRDGNEFATPVRDLMEAGMEYANTASAFQNFRNDYRKASYKATNSNDGHNVDVVDGGDEEEVDEDLMDAVHDGGIDFEDSLMDDEEYPEGTDPHETVSMIKEMISAFPGVEMELE